MLHVRLLANFPRPWSDAQEIKLIKDQDDANDKSKIWHPTIKDFQAVAAADDGKSSHTHIVSTVKDMLTRINSKPDASILVLSIITHATEGLVGLSGSVDTNGMVRIGGDDGPSIDARGLDGYIVDRGGVLNDWSKGKGTTGRKLRDIARSKFHENAAIIVYGCNTGRSALSYNLLRCISKTFNVTSFGFRSYIKYHPRFKDGRITDRTRTALAAGPWDDVWARAKPGVGHLAPDIPFVPKPVLGSMHQAFE